MRNVCLKKENTSRATCPQNPVMILRIYRDEDARLISLEQFTPRLIPRFSIVHFSQAALSTRASSVHEASRTNFPTRHQDEKSRRAKSTTAVDVPGFSFLLSRCSGCVQEWTGCWLPSIPGLIYAAHFRLRHPGARQVRGPKSYTPTLHLFVQLRRRRSHRPERPPLPFGTDAPLPLPYKYTSHEETLFSFFNEQVSLSSSFVECSCLWCLTSFFFSRRISSSVPLLRFGFICYFL